MASANPLERKVAQLDNDVSAIYTMIADVQNTQRRHDNRFKELAEHLQEHDVRFDGIDGRLDGIDGRLDGIDGRLDGVDGRLDGIDGRLDGIDGRLDGLSTQVGEVLALLRPGDTEG